MNDSPASILKLSFSSSLKNILSFENYLLNQYLQHPTWEKNFFKHVILNYFLPESFLKILYKLIYLMNDKETELNMKKTKIQRRLFQDFTHSLSGMVKSFDTQ